MLFRIAHRFDVQIPCLFPCYQGNFARAESFCASSSSSVERMLTRELSLQTEEDKIVLHPNIGELYARKIGELKSLIQNDATKHQATEIIRSLIEKIVVSPTGQRGKSDVILHGALASILAYASDTAQSGAVSSRVGRILLVAGAGFEPATFRL